MAEVELRYCCPTCLCKVATQRHLVEHYRIVHKKYLPGSRSTSKHIAVTPVSGNADTFGCTQCEYKCNNPVLLVQHVGETHRKEEEEEEEGDDRCCRYDPPTKKHIYDAMLASAPEELLAQELERELEQINKIMDGYSRGDSIWRDVRAYGKTEYGWSDQYAEDITVELYRALYCKKIAGYGNLDGSLNAGLPLLVDQAWHAAILNTRSYAIFCRDRLRLNNIIPHSTNSIADDDEHKDRRIRLTMDLYKRTFNRDPPAKYWPVEEEEEEEKEECKHRCKNKEQCKHPCCKHHLSGKRKREQEQEQEPVEIQIYVKTLYGVTYGFRLAVGTSVRTLVQLSSQKAQEPIDGIRMIYCGRQLDPLGNELITEAWNEGTVHLILKLRAC